MKKIIFSLVLFATPAAAQDNWSIAPNVRALSKPSIGRDFVAANSEYLSMAEANFGEYDKSIFGVSVWVKPTDITTVGILAHGIAGSNRRAFEIGIDASSHPYCAFSDTGSAWTTLTLSSTTMSGKIWYHVVCQFDGTQGTDTNRIKGYVNGSADAATVSAGFTTLYDNENDPVIIGADNTPANYFDGMIFQPCIYSGGLVPVSRIYSGGALASCPRLNLWAALGGGIGDTVTRDAVLATEWTDNATVNIAKRSSPSTVQLPTLSLDFGTATNVFLSMTDGNFGAFDRAKFAFSAWLYPTSSGTNRIFFSQYSSAGNRAFQMRLLSSNAVQVNILGDGTNTENVQCSSSLTTNAWGHVLVTFDGSQTTGSKVKIYLNGTNCTGTDGVTATSVFDSTANVQLGATASISGYVGLMYNPCFYSGGLPAVADVYNGSAVKSCSATNLWAAWPTNGWRALTVDARRTTDWTNNNSVATSATVP